MTLTRIGWRLKKALMTCEHIEPLSRLLFHLCFFSIFRGLQTHVRVFPGATDSCYLREVGIPALGFSPINNTPVLLHNHDEYLGAETYLHGIQVYRKLIPALADS